MLYLSINDLDATAWPSSDGIFWFTVLFINIHVLGVVLKSLISLKIKSSAHNQEKQIHSFNQINILLHLISMSMTLISQIY